MSMRLPVGDETADTGDPHQHPLIAQFTQRPVTVSEASMSS